MATSFIKSFMEVVNPTASRAAKRSQDPQDPRVKRVREPQAATNALLDATSTEALEERPASLEIVVIPPTVQSWDLWMTSVLWKFRQTKLPQRIYHNVSS